MASIIECSSNSALTQRSGSGLTCIACILNLDQWNQSQLDLKPTCFSYFLLRWSCWVRHSNLPKTASQEHVASWCQESPTRWSSMGVQARCRRPPCGLGATECAARQWGGGVTRDWRVPVTSRESPLESGILKICCASLTASCPSQCQWFVVLHPGQNWTSLFYHKLLNGQLGDDTINIQNISFEKDVCLNNMHPNFCQLS